jgi:peptidoglycan/LPS O-acetylase OafA/YrhL
VLLEARETLDLRRNMADHGTQLKRLPGLDGLRALAIGLVLLRHVENFAQGWIGVDIFFVLSGYLITTILMKERRDPHFWRIFYIRRATRILPPFLLLLLCGSLMGYIHWRELWPYLIFTGEDVAYIRHKSEIMDSNLGVLWSLAVEEHFYFVWPVIVRNWSQRAIVTLLVALMVLEPLARTIATLCGLDWSLIYFLTPFRLDGLALGSLLAIAMLHKEARRWIDKIVPTALPVCFVSLVASYRLMVHVEHPLAVSAYIYSLIAITSAVALAYIVLRPTSVLANVFAWKPFVFIGRISYGIYLYHFLVLAVMMHVATKRGYPHVTRIVLLSVPVTILLSWLSFRYYESFFLRWARRKANSFRDEPAMSPEIHLV